MADIELVIKIPEEDWEFIKEADGCRWSRAILDGVINGIPLPKGHDRLIDAGVLLKQSYCIDDSATLSTRYVVNKEAIDDALTIIEADKEKE